MIITNETELRQPCLDASLFEAQNIINILSKELASSNTKGVGLAANQIGINKKICIIRIDKYELDLVNPVIVDTQDLCLFKNEGCLSFPDEWLSTKRYNEVFVTDLLHPAGVVCTGLAAVVVQHEVGHLYGETMYDYRVSMPLGPNSPCWCGSGKKFKKCHTGKEIKA
jgi:peptide deformylase